MRPLALALLAALVAPACGHERLAYTLAVGPRDWSAHPAIVDTDAAVVYAVSDVHGGYDRLAALLARHGLVDPPSSPDAARWTGGAAVLVVAGDLVDKGPRALEAIDLLRALEAQAPASGGRVIVTLGNHEAELLYDPGNAKATASDGVDQELDARGIDPASVASGRDPRGAWLRDRPLGARVGRWFFAHAGDTHGRTLADLDGALRAAVDAHFDYDDAELVGGASLLESRDWYSADATTAARYAQAIGARHIVMGHDPKALGPRGAIAVAYDGALFRIDCGMSPDVNDSDGRMLRVRVDGTSDVAESLAPDGTIVELWRGAI